MSTRKTLTMQQKKRLEKNEDVALFMVTFRKKKTKNILLNFLLNYLKRKKAGSLILFFFLRGSSIRQEVRVSIWAWPRAKQKLRMFLACTPTPPPAFLNTWASSNIRV